MPLRTHLRDVTLEIASYESLAPDEALGCRAGQEAFWKATAYPEIRLLPLRDFEHLKWGHLDIGNSSGQRFPIDEANRWKRNRAGESVRWISHAAAQRR